MKDVTFGVPYVEGKDGQEGKQDADHTGYQGRKSIIEVLPITQTMKGLIEKRSSMDVLEAQARKEGMLTMLEDGVVKAAAKLTSIEEVFRVISE
jgi:type II secretory ATPase GspE/PulE/Tfp pilus assembly ATPase PilB-like protein